MKNNNIIKRYGNTAIILAILLIPFYISFAAVTDDGNLASITWTSTVSGKLSSFNYDTAAFQGWNNSPTWGAFSVASWTGFFGSFTHIRMFDGDCSSLSMAACEALGNGYKDYWVNGSNWSLTDPAPTVSTVSDLVLFE